jgi:hypothetical protein
MLEEISLNRYAARWRFPGVLYASDDQIAQGNET